LGDLVSIRSEVESLRQQTNSLALSLEGKRRLQARNAQPPGGASSILERKEEERKLAIGRMNYTRQWLLAFRMFADENRDQFPTSFDEAQPFLPKETAADTNFTTGQFEIVYQGSITNITAPALVVVLREKPPRRGYDGKWSRAYGFADGHSEIASSPDGSYADWEKRHIVAPSRDQ
jgi:hypothetical protein